MRTPVQRTLISLAVSSACTMFSAGAWAQEQVQPPAADSATAEAPPAPPAVPTVAADTNVVRISGSRIVARGFSQPTPTTSLSSADLE